MIKELIFAGGGSGGSSHQVDDNLRSDDTAELLIGLCEGPIEGLEDGEKSFFLDDVPLVSSDDTNNFEDFKLDVKKGNLTDDEIITLSLGGSSTPTNVGSELFYNKPVTKICQLRNIDYIDVRIIVGKLYRITSKGTYNSSVQFTIEYKRTNETTWNMYGGKSQTISGKTMSNYAQDFRIVVPKDPNYSYEIRVTKKTPDSPDSEEGDFNALYFGQFEEIVAMEKRFDNTAIAHIQVRTSEQLSQIPQFSGIYKGLVVKVPSNYDAESRHYDGEWDGTFKLAYTNNPAWCLYDLIVNDRYGVNAHYPVNADKWDFYEAAKYCDELVPDGRNGLEPRYTLNIVISEAKSGYEVLNYIAATFNGTIYEDGSNMVRLAIDNPGQATHLFTKENITETGFQYSFSDPSTRYNDFTVSFINSESNWEEDRRRVSDDAHIEEWGQTPFDFQAVGCIKESEALRRARFRMISGLTEVMSVSFTTNRVAQNINIFDVILVSDPDMNYSLSGRIHSVEQNRTTVHLRDPLFLEAGSLYAMKVQTTDGIVECEVDVREVGEVKTLYLLDKLPNNVPEYAVFSLEGTDHLAGFPKPFKVLSISEAENDAETITINAIEINRNKQYEADTGFDLTEIEPSTRPNYLVVPHALDAVFNQTYIQLRKESQLIIGLVLDYKQYPYYTGSFLCYSRLKVKEGEEENPWEKRDVVYGDTILNHPAGPHEFILLPLTVYGTTPSFDTAPIFEYDVFDLQLPPENIRNFKVTPTINNFKLTWDPIEDVDLVGYEIRIGDDWDTGTVIADFLVDTTYYYTTDDTSIIKFMIKAIDSFGNYSEYYAFAQASLAAPQDIKAFYVTPNLDNLRFDWVSENENGVEYEVRSGQSWDSGLLLFKTKGKNQTILNPTQNGVRGFMIKAVSQAGLYSNNFRYAEANLALKQNRNVIREIDNVKDDWEGITNGFERSEFDDVLVMYEGYVFAEHYFEVHLEEKTRARNWFETEGFKFGDRLTFEDLTYTWGSVEAESHNWLNTIGLTSLGGEIQPVITYSLGEEYGGFLGFSMNKTLADMREEIFPNYQKEVVYGSARYTNGLVVNKLVNVRYDGLDIPKEFSMKFKLKITKKTADYLKILRLANDTNYVDLALENFDLTLRKSDGTKVSDMITKFESYDFMTVMVTQTASKIIVDYSCEYANIKGKLESESSSTKAFTKLYIGGLYE